MEMEGRCTSMGRIIKSINAILPEIQHLSEGGAQSTLILAK